MGAYLILFEVGIPSENTVIVHYSKFSKLVLYVAKFIYFGKEHILILNVPRSLYVFLFECLFLQFQCRRPRKPSGYLIFSKANRKQLLDADPTKGMSYERVNLNCLGQFCDSKAIGIINLAKPFLNFIDDTMILYLNSKLDLNLSCVKDCLNLNSMW